MRYKRILLLATWSGLVALIVQATQAATFQGLGDLAGGGAPPVPISSGDPAYESQGKGVSPNGSVVVGTSIGSGSPATGAATSYKWTAGGGMVDIGDHPTAVYYSTAVGVTNNETVTGYGDRLGNYYGQIMQWKAPAGSAAPAELPMLNPYQRLYSYTADHPITTNSSGQTVIAGYLGEIPYGNSIEAAVWVKTSVDPAPLTWSIKKLGWLGPGISPAPGPSDPPRSDPINGGYKDYSYTFAINTPATHIVGFSQSGNLGVPADEADPNFRLPQAVIWTDPTGTWASPPAAQSLGFIGGPGVSNASSAGDITNNGITVVGSGCTNNNCGGASPTGQNQAFIGTVGNPNLTALGVLPVNNPSVIASSRAVAIAGDGTTVVGWSTTDVGVLSGSNPIAVTTRTAFIWDPVLTSGTMMNLKTYLTNSQGLGAALTGWTLKEANDISDDGTVIVGTGINPSGNYEAFRVVLDLAAAPDYGDYNSDGFVDAADYTVWRNNLGAANETSIHGNGDGGGVGEGDYTLWKQFYGHDYSGGSGGISAAVPEPASWMLVVAGVIVATSLAVRRRDSR